MYLGNDTSRESFADNFARNRDEAFVQSPSKKWLCHFFDSLSRTSRGASGRLLEKAVVSAVSVQRVMEAVFALWAARWLRACSRIQPSFRR